MRTALLFFLSAVAAFAQTGTVDVRLSVTAVAGNLTCTITPQSGTFTIACATPTWQMAPIPVTPEAGSPDAVTVQVNKGPNAITMTVSQMVASAPVAWSVAANGVAKSGTF